MKKDKKEKQYFCSCGNSRSANARYCSTCAAFVSKKATEALNRGVKWVGGGLPGDTR